MESHEDDGSVNLSEMSRSLEECLQECVDFEVEMRICFQSLPCKHHVYFRFADDGRNKHVGYVSGRDIAALYKRLGRVVHEHFAKYE